jgi:SHS2 domain-containing protein
MGSHALLPHTGEVQIRIEASSLADLFAEAAHALAELVAMPAREPPSPWRSLELAARDREALLVAWLDELIVRTELDDLVYDDAKIIAISDRRLRASIRGTRIAEPRTAVKAATFHRLRIEEDRGAVRATVTLDV